MDVGLSVLGPLSGQGPWSRLKCKQIKYFDNKLV